MNFWNNETLLTVLSAGTYGLRPDRIVTGDHVIAVDPLVIIENGTIAFCGQERDASIPEGSIEIMRLRGATIVPGAVDAHNHVRFPFAKGMTFGEPAQLWKRVWLPLEAAATDVTDYFGAKWTFMEALRGGFTTIVDSAIQSPAQTAAVMRAATETGIRLVSSTGVFDIQDFETSAQTPQMVTSTDEALAVADAHKAMCVDYPLVAPSIACGQIQTNSPATIGALAGWCQDNGALFQIHANEHSAEVHHSLERYGHRPIEMLGELGVLGPHVLIAHANLTTPGELTLVAQADAALSYNPVASQWKGNAAANALMWHEFGIRFGLGTDNTRNDAFRLIDAADATARLVHAMEIDDFEAGSGSIWWKAATVNGARAAGFTDLGELVAGSKADFLILDSATLETMPSWKLIWELGRFYDKSNIKAVVVDGKPRVIDGSPVGWDLEQFIDEALDCGLGHMAAAEPVTVREGTPTVFDPPRSS